MEAQKTKRKRTKVKPVYSTINHEKTNQKTKNLSQR